MNAFQSHLDWIDAQQSRRVDLLLRWSAINSGSRNLAGLARMADMLSDEFAKLGGIAEWIKLPGQDTIDRTGQMVLQPLGRALRITKRPHAPRQILLAIHYDTVFDVDHPFQSPTITEQNMMRGPGVADAKGGIVVLLTALEAFEKSECVSQVGWEILLTPDEEIGSPGSSPIFVQAAKRNHIGLVFEPALPDGSLVGARKGSGNFTCIVKGRAAHAGRNPEMGRNAILAAVDLILQIEAVRTISPGVTVNIGHIEGGGPVNIVPDLAILRFNIRVDTIGEQKRVESHLLHILETMNRRDGIDATLHGTFTAPPKLLNPSTEQLLDQIKTIGNEIDLRLSGKSAGGVCDGNRLAAAGLPTVDTLGPRGGELHSSTEYVLLDSLTERAKLTALLLYKYATGELSPPSRESFIGEPQ